MILISGPGTPAHGMPGRAGPAALQDDDLISLGSQVIRDVRGGRLLTLHWEIRVAAGRHGKRLVLEQAAAIRDVHAWIARKRSWHEDPGSTAEHWRLSGRWARRWTTAKGM